MAVGFVAGQSLLARSRSRLAVLPAGAHWLIELAWFVGSRRVPETMVGLKTTMVMTSPLVMACDGLSMIGVTMLD